MLEFGFCFSRFYFVREFLTDLGCQGYIGSVFAEMTWTGVEGTSVRLYEKIAGQSCSNGWNQSTLGSSTVAASRFLRSISQHTCFSGSCFARDQARTELTKKTRRLLSSSMLTCPQTHPAQYLRDKLTGICSTALYLQ